jgi:hypothetical protein
LKFAWRDELEAFIFLFLVEDLMLSAYDIGMAVTSAEIQGDNGTEDANMMGHLSVLGVQPAVIDMGYDDIFGSIRM